MIDFNDIDELDETFLTYNQMYVHIEWASKHKVYFKVYKEDLEHFFNVLHYNGIPNKNRKSLLNEYEYEYDKMRKYGLFSLNRGSLFNYIEKRYGIQKNITVIEYKS